MLRVSDGVQIPLDSLWQDRRVVLIFLRHLGCRFCLEQTDALVQSGLARRLKESGVATVAVSLGSLEESTEWLEKTGFSSFGGEFYVDPSTNGAVTATEQLGSAAYRAFKLKRGTQYVLNHPKTAEKAEATLAKFPDREPKTVDDITIYPGDVFQVGGAFVLGPGNFCDFHFRCEYAGDLIDLEALEIAATGTCPDGSEHVYPSTKAWFDRLQAGSIVDIPDISLWAHRARPLLMRYWRHIAAASSLAVGVQAFRRNNTNVGVGCVGLAGAVVGTGWLFRPPRLADSVKLMSAKEVDKMVVDLGLMECDCAGVVAAIPMEGETTELEAQSFNLPRPRAKTWTVQELDGARPNEYQATLCYIREFLGKPHPCVGRKGPVCPFVPKALTLDAAKMGVIRTKDIPKHELKATLSKLLIDFIPRFESMEPKEGRLRQYKTVIFIFPDVAIADAKEVIDGAQAAAKIDFVARGLMVGEFHAANNAAGLRNANFFPLRTPHPCLAIRHMVPGDYVFMTLENYTTDLQKKFLKSFLDVFGEEDRNETRDARKRLQQLES